MPCRAHQSRPEGPKGLSRGKQYKSSFPIHRLLSDHTRPFIVAMLTSWTSSTRTTRAWRSRCSKPSTSSAHILLRRASSFPRRTRTQGGCCGTSCGTFSNPCDCYSHCSWFSIVSWLGKVWDGAPLVSDAIALDTVHLASHSTLHLVILLTRWLV